MMAQKLANAFISDLAMGLAAHPWEKYGLFLEYRHVAFDASFFTTNSIFWPTSNTYFEASFSDDQILLGFTVYFSAQD